MKIRDFFKIAVTAIKNGFLKYGKLIIGPSSILKKILFIGGGVVLPVAFAAKEMYNTMKTMDPKPQTIMEHSLCNDLVTKDATDPEVKAACETLQKDMTKNLYGKKMYKKHKKYAKKNNTASVTEKQCTNSLREIYDGTYDPNGFSKSYSHKELEDLRQEIVDMVASVKERAKKKARNRVAYGF